jgi:CBS domain containing-hemolysin-like protein
MTNFRKLKTTSLAEIVNIERPSRNTHATLDSPASEVFTDFTLQAPLMLEKSTTIEDAKALMAKTHVKLKLVIDSAESFLGVVTLADLVSVRVMRAMEKTGLRREDLTVADIMTPRKSMHAIDVVDIASAKIGDLLKTMEDFGDQHVLVVDAGHQQIRGLISATDIARCLHVPLQINERANSFSQIYETVRASA